MDKDREKPMNALKLDANGQKNFIKFYNNLDEKPSTTIRFFDRVDYYSCHGEDDSRVVSDIVHKSTAYIKMMAPPNVSAPLPYITLSKGNFEKALRELLLVKNYRVEVYTKQLTDEMGSEWKVEFRGSPGNLIQFEDILFSNNEIAVGSSILSINIKQEGNQKKVGMACVEMNDCVISVTEFVDDDFFSGVEASVVVLGPKECLLPSAAGDFERIKTLMERNRAMISIRKKTDFQIKQTDLNQDLKNLLRFKKGQVEDANSIPETAMQIAMSALGAAIKYLDLSSDSANLGNYEIKHMNLNRFVHLDAAAVSALNLLPRPGTTPSSAGYRWQSILGVIDHCKTPQGHRLIAQWIKQPLRNEASLRDRHDIVECLVDSPTALSSIHDEHLKRIYDIQLLIKKLQRKRATLQELFRIYQIVIRAPKIVTELMALENATVNSVICVPFKANLEDLSGLKKMVEQVLDFTGIQRNEYLIRASFDDDLQDLRSDMDNIYKKMQKLLDNVIDDLELESKSVKLEHVGHLGHHFRISLKNDTSLRKCKKYRILDAIKSGVRFTSDKLSELNTKFNDLKESYEEKQKSIVEEVIRIALGYLGPLATLNQLIAEIDCLVSFGICARSAPITYVRPTILPEGSGILKLKAIRHPCIELKENVNYISNDVDFEKDKTVMNIITGPNMGGKSTYIRSVGTAVLLAHIGSFVPCESATISMVDSILGRIGASDNPMKGLSTFMVEMVETSGIIRTATDKSLVIIDELGRGTSTYEGCGLAWAIAEHLARETRCFSLFATHFHEITALSESTPTVKNFHMDALVDDKSITLLYRIKPGIMLKSFGIHVARLAKFPKETIELAEDMYKKFDDPYVHLKVEADFELERRIDEAVLKYSQRGEHDDEFLTKMVEDFQKEAANLNTEYMKAIKQKSDQKAIE